MNSIKPVEINLNPYNKPPDLIRDQLINFFLKNNTVIELLNLTHHNDPDKKDRELAHILGLKLDDNKKSYDSFKIFNRRVLKTLDNFWVTGAINLITGFSGNPVLGAEITGAVKLGVEGIDELYGYLERNEQSIAATEREMQALAIEQNLIIKGLNPVRVRSDREIYMDKFR